MFLAHSTHEVVVPAALDNPQFVPYCDWTMATRMVLRLMSMTSGTMTIIGTARPNTVAPFTRPCPPFPVLSAIGPSHHRHAYCNPFHADTGGTDADNQKKPRRRTTPGKRIMTIGLRKDRLKNEPTTGNIRCGIIPHLIFRTAVGLANDMEGIISYTATTRVGEGRSVIPQPGRGPWRSRCRRS